MVVVAIVGVLSAVGLPQLTKAQDKAKQRAGESELVSAGKTCGLDYILSTTDYDPSKFPKVDEGASVCGASTNVASSMTSTIAGKVYTIDIDTNGQATAPVETDEAQGG
jgi:type II secretory pathway pseudopilin PulG